MKTMKKMIILILLLSSAAFNSAVSQDENGRKTIVCGEILNSPFDSVSIKPLQISFLHTGLYKNINLVKKIDNNGVFRFEFPLDSFIVMQMSVVSYKAGYPMVREICNFSVDGGDSVYVKFDFQNKQNLSFGGENSADQYFIRNNRSSNVKKIRNTIKTLNSVEEKFDFIDSNLNREIANLLLFKDKLSAKCYRFCYYEFVYGAANLKFWILHDPANSDATQSYPPDYYNFLNSLKISNDSALISHEYKEFILKYFNYKLSALDVENPQFLSQSFGQPKHAYYLTEVLFSGKTEILLKSYVIETVVRSNTILENQEIISDFFEKNSLKDIQKLKNFYEKSLKLIPGSIAPDFSFPRINGETVSLKQFQGKFVYVCFSNFDHWYNNEQQKFIENVSSELANENIILLFVYTGNNIGEWKSLNEPTTNTFFLYDTLWHSNPYNLHIFDFGRLIDKQGVIASKLYFYSAGFVAEVKNIMNSHKIQKGVINKNLIRIIITLIVAIPFIVIWLSWRIKKKEAVKRKKTELELRVIRSQLNPHFLFNSLNSIQNLVNKKATDKANLYISKFAGLMRMTLNNSEKAFIPVSDELAMISDYCELEALRFDFEFTINVEAGFDVHTHEIPGMILQPFVENAILHGLSKSKRKGKLQIEIHIENQQLVCIIQDNGIGINVSKALDKNKNKHNFGLKSAKERLKILKQSRKEDYSVKIQQIENENNEPQGTEVKIRLPLAD
jgi:SAM-dependent methyltransferase